MKRLIEFLSKNRTAVIAVVVLLVLLVGGGTYWGVSRYRAGKDETKTIGADLSYTEGVVEVKDKDADWVKAEKDKDLAQGDSIRVNGDGKAIVTIDDGSAIRLSSNSAVTLTSLNPSHTIITNDLGNVYSRVAKADRTFEVMNSGYVFKSLGTAYKTVNTDKEKGVNVYASNVDVKKDGQKDGGVVVPEGKKFYLTFEADKKNENAIVDLTKDEIKKDTFVMWCKEQDEKDDGYKKDLGILGTITEDPITPPETPADPGVTANITLSGYATDSGVKLSWTVAGVDIANGFKLVKSTSINPVYPGNSAVYLKSTTNAYHWSITDGGTYYFRACQYTGGGCGTYSNNIKVTAPKITTEKPPTTSSQTAKVTWSVDEVGHTISMSTSYVLALLPKMVAPVVTAWPTNGFKLVWSKNPSPTYPTRSGDKYNYYSDPSTRSGIIDAFSGSGKYYVRVCEYLGGACGVYSNQVEVTLP
jgi:hypothetical protein